MWNTHSFTAGEMHKFLEKHRLPKSQEEIKTWMKLNFWLKSVLQIRFETFMTLLINFTQYQRKKQLQSCRVFLKIQDDGTLPGFFMRPELPWYQCQTKTSEEKRTYEPTSCMSI